MKQLTELAIDKKEDVIEWIYSHLLSPPLFLSVDIRSAEFKIAPVDANVFPAGFNNLSPTASNKAIEMIKRRLGAQYPTAKRIALIKEDITRNDSYLKNIESLSAIITTAGYQVEVVSLQGLESATFNADLIILNNDLTIAPPKSLVNSNIPVIPRIEYGWYNRYKSLHFSAYDKVAEQFASHFAIDKWHISSCFAKCSDVDFREKQGLVNLAEAASVLLEKIKKKYQEYQIGERPYIFLKADKGTYGMGIMTIHDPEEILQINKKKRHSMHTIKSGIKNTEILLQEGVMTDERIGNSPAERLSYLVGGEVVEMLFRYNENKDAFANLNSRGMGFIPAPNQDFSPAERLSYLSSQCYQQ